VPLAPTDGVLLAIDRREWQDGIYASLKAVKERRHKEAGYEVHPFERARIDQLMSELRDAKG
jgi:hypothetical protein